MLVPAATMFDPQHTKRCVKTHVPGCFCLSLLCWSQQELMVGFQTDVIGPVVYKMPSKLNT